MTDSVRSLLRSGWQIYRSHGVRQAARDGFFYGYETALRTGCSLFGRSQGDNIFEDDWDILLILDACRADLIREVQDEYSFLEQIDTRWSVASTSAEWMENTFDDQYRNETANTTYVTGNPFSDSHIEDRDFAVVHELWRTNWDNTAGTIRPRPLTDRAIEHWRASDNDRLIVHYMQPHYPFLGSSLSENGLSLENWGEDVTTKNVWEQLRDKEIDLNSLWEAYLENLRVVLDDVELLLEAVDADTVAITADHGNGVGECGVYGHPGGICFSPLREVPWITTTAERIREYEPAPAEESPVNVDVTDRLEALGYR